MTDLRTAAQHALEACEQRLPLVGQANIIDELNALRAALAQEQAEPVAWMGAYDKTELYYRKPPQADVVPLYAAPPKAEPAQEPAAWEASKDGCTIQGVDFTHDVVLRVSGDFENDEQRIRRAKRIVDALNAAPPRRTMLPLTDEEIMGAFHAARNAKLGASQDNSKHRLSVLEIARAIEKASWEKNHG